MVDGARVASWILPDAVVTAPAGRLSGQLGLAACVSRFTTTVAHSGRCARRGGTVPQQGHEFETFGTVRPQSFGPYTVLGELGNGGMGVVYRALDTRLQRQVAVKVLHRDLTVSGPRSRFLREARLVSSLSHPNICTVFDIGEEDGDPYLVMELLEGESLKERIERGPMSPEDVHEVAFRVALALQAAHARGIVHRDIKPANLFLGRNANGLIEVKVLDFGLAKLAESHRSRQGTVDDLTRSGATVGTVEYMSPEQACGEAVDARSDLFSLGVVLYEMATGTVPFRGATSAMVFSELLNRDPVPPREKNMNVPASLDGIIRALLTKDRAHRLGSASAMLNALADASVESSAVTGVTPAGAPSPPLPLATRHVVTHAKPSAHRAPGDESRPMRGERTCDSAYLPVEPASHKPRTRKRREEYPAAGPSLVRTTRIGPPAVVAENAGEETVHTGWKVALVAGVVVAVLLTLLIILAMSHVRAATA